MQFFTSSFFRYTLFLVQVRLQTKYYAPQVWPDWGLNSWPPDHDSTLRVTATPALTTRPSVTRFCLYFSFSIYMYLDARHLHFIGNLFSAAIFNVSFKISLSVFLSALVPYISVYVSQCVFLSGQPPSDHSLSNVNCYAIGIVMTLRGCYWNWNCNFTHG